MAVFEMGRARVRELGVVAQDALEPETLQEEPRRRRRRARVRQVDHALFPVDVHGLDDVVLLCLFARWR